MTEELKKEKKVEDIKKEADSIRCPVQRSLYFAEEFLGGPMCGKCFPCEMGTYEAKLRLEKISSGKGTEADISALEGIFAEMLDISRCKRGKDTAQFILEWMKADDFKAHVSGPKCAARECKGLIEYRIIPEKCTMCGLCKDACPSGAIIGEKKSQWLGGYLPFEIRQLRCSRAGECKKVCPADAVEIVDAFAPALAVKEYNDLS